MNSKKIKLKIKIEKPFGNLFREATVLIVCQTPEKSYLFGEKSYFYPTGIVRLIGGGIEKHSKSPIETAQMELSEEVNYRPKKEELVDIGQFNIEAIDQEKKTYNHTIYLFFWDIPERIISIIKAQDDLSGIKKLTISDFAKLIENYKNLTKKNRYVNERLDFSWYDYAQVYGPVHQFVFDLLEK